MEHIIRLYRRLVYYPFVRNRWLRKNHQRLRMRTTLLVMLLFLWYPPCPRNPWALLLVVAGIIWRVWAAGFVHKASEVTLGGPYRWVRHPLYFGSLLIGLGLSLYIGAWPLLLLAIFHFIIIYGLTILIEEDKLTGRFSAYGEYRDSVPCIFPYHPPGPMRESGKWSWNQFLKNREYRQLAGVALFLIVLILRGYLLPSP